MDRKAFIAARTEFDRAHQSLIELGASNNFAEIERCWTSFLVSAGRVFTKLEQGQKHSAKSRAWWSKKVHQRRTDPLLCYIWHARNADEQTIAPVTNESG